MTSIVKRAVIAEDNQILREIIARALAWTGNWEIVKVADGAEALATIGAHGAGLAILDWKMASMDGLECTRRIRAGEKGVDPALPVILVTAAGQELTEEMARGAGVNKLIRKPFSLAQLYSAIQDIAG